MKPHEFWNSTYREAKQYVDSRSLQEESILKNYILLADNLGDKINLMSMSVENPRPISLLKDRYKDLFKEELARLDAFHKKASEGEELIQLMNELDEELKNEQQVKEDN